MSYNLKLTTGHFQFYLCAKDSRFATDSDDFWTEAALRDKLAIEDGVLGISIGTYGFVNATIDVLPHRGATFPIDECDHVVEGSIEISSGVLQVLDCPFSKVELELTLPPGFYRARICASGLELIADENEEAEDSYRIELWPEAPSVRRVLKRATFNW